MFPALEPRPDPSSVFAAGRLGLLRHDRRRLALVALPVVASHGILLPILLFGEVGSVGVVISLVVALYGWRWVLTSLRETRRRRVEWIDVRADRDGLRLGSRFLPRRRLKAGLVDLDDEPRVLLRRRFGPAVVLRVDDAEQGRALLQALGLDITHALVSFRCGSVALSRWRYAGPIAGAVAVALVVAVVAGVQRLAEPSAIIAGLAAVVGLAVVVVAMPRKVTIGADGLVTSWFGWKRFIPHRRVVDVWRAQASVVGSPSRGLEICLLAGDGVSIDSTNEEVRQIEARLWEGREIARGLSPPTSDLRRAGRTMRAWLAALRAIGADSRERRRLLAVVEAPGAWPADRAAACVALARHQTAADRARLRATARRVADPRLTRFLRRQTAGAGEAETATTLSDLEGEQRSG